MLTNLINRRRALSRLSAASALPLAMKDTSASPRHDFTPSSVNVIDFMTREMLDDVRRGLVRVDCAPAFQAAINAATARGASTLTAGRRLVIPGGRYLIASPLRFVWRDEEKVVDDGDMRRLSIEGHGSANVVIFYRGDESSPALDVRGYKAEAGGGTSLRLHISGLRLRRHPDFHGSGMGLRLNGVEGVVLRDVEVAMFDTNVEAVDTLRFVADESWFLGARVGLHARGDTFSSPNIYTFANCNFGGNADVAALLDSGCNIAFRSCAFEGNGSQRGIGACVLLRNGPSQGGAAAHLDTCYFENNLVVAEVLVDWTTPDGGTIKLTACTFQRASQERASTHIALRSSKATMLVHMDSCAFKSFDSYRATIANPVITTTGSEVAVTYTACYFQNSIEMPASLRSRSD